MNHKKLILHVISFFLFIVAAIYITYPLIFHLGDLVTGFGDELVIAWIQNWVIHALMTNPFGLFEANLYFPYHNTLAYADTDALTSVLAFPVRIISGEPIATINYTLFSSLILLGFSIYLLCYYLTKNVIVSLFSGMLVIFSPATLDYTVHVQILSAECVPLAILSFLHFIKTKQTRFFALSLFFFVLQMYNSIMLGYFIVFSYAIIFLFHIFAERKKTLKLVSRKNVILLIVAFALLIPLARAYFSVSNEFHYVRDIRDAIHFAFQPEDFLYPGNRTRLASFLSSSIPTNQFSQNSEFKHGYLGIVFSLLVLFSFFYVIKNFRKISIDIKSFLSIAILGFVLSLGPLLHLARHTIHKPFPIPLPYILFYYLIPGFQGIRNSARWDMLLIIGIAVVIALVLDQVLSKASFKKQAMVFTILLLGIVVELSPLILYPIQQKKDFPKVYSWMATTPKNATFIIIPIYNWTDQIYVGQETWREYYGTVDFRRTMNGYTGFSPPPWQVFIHEMHKTFPQKKSLAMIQAMGVEYIIIDEAAFDKEYKDKANKFNGKTIVELLKKNKSVILIKTIDNYAVFKFDAKK